MCQTAGHPTCGVPTPGLGRAPRSARSSAPALAGCRQAPASAPRAAATCTHAVPVSLSAWSLNARKQMAGSQNAIPAARRHSLQEELHHAAAQRPARMQAVHVLVRQNYLGAGRRLRSCHVGWGPCGAARCVGAAGARFGGGGSARTRAARPGPRPKRQARLADWKCEACAKQTTPSCWEGGTPRGPLFSFQAARAPTFKRATAWGAGPGAARWGGPTPRCCHSLRSNRQRGGV